jgi:N utilization substance protein B
MASNRHLGRIIVLQTLYEQDFRQFAGDSQFDLDEVLARNIARYESMVDDLDFIQQLVHGVSNKIPELDAALQPIAPEWPIEQIARIDRTILRIGLYELTFEPDVPPKVVINEAVELAKAFGSDNSSKFVNGVLGTALRQKDESAQSQTKKSTAKATKTGVNTKTATKSQKPLTTKSAAKAPKKKD